MNGMRGLIAILSTLLALEAVAGLGTGEKDGKTQETKAKTADECQAPKWAIAIGHEQMWKLHNGCPTDKEKSKSNQ